MSRMPTDRSGSFPVACFSRWFDLEFNSDRTNRASLVFRSTVSMSTGIRVHVAGIGVQDHRNTHAG